MDIYRLLVDVYFCYGENYLANSDKGSDGRPFLPVLVLFPSQNFKDRPARPKKF